VVGDAPADLGGRLSHALFLTPFLQLMKLRLRVRTCANDHVFGYNDTGSHDAGAVLEFPRRCARGRPEMYFHAATPALAGDRARSGNRTSSKTSSPRW